ncbi:MAG: LytTR family DNA-binding domain-containing protein [Bacteroidales bacterium]|jgi:two-component system LytT family response regulator|nr:LytTR family DNA-binding domain-containing protein [Bacteroidales bacterium]
MIRTIVIDDEVKARETILKMLSTYCPDIEVVATAGSVKEGIKTLGEIKPDLLLLDIKMADGTGFDLLKKLDNIDFRLIFITAFEEFAIRAIKFSAIDYILKPFDPDELINAIEKAGNLIQKDHMSLRLDALYENLDLINTGQKKIVLKTADNVHIVKLNEIIRCESEKNYTHFYTIENEKITVSRTLKEFNELLSGYNFYRVHQSHLVNLDHVKRYEKIGSGKLIMDNDSEVPVSFRKKEDLMKIFKSL